jgi:hypothetical protein
VAYWAAKARYRGRLAGWLAGGTEPAADRNAWLAAGTGGGPVPVLAGRRMPGRAADRCRVQRRGWARGG